MARNRYVAGIDLGTSNSCVGVIRDDRVFIVQDVAGSRVTPSVVAFTKNGMAFGEAAKRFRRSGDPNVIYEVKRIIGQKYSAPAVQDEITNWTFKVVPTIDDNPRIPITLDKVTKYYCPEAISAKLISYLVDMAKQATGGIINEIVITCPAYFTEKQRRATRDAGEIAGYEVLTVLNEPAAAAIAYGFEHMGDDHTLLVYDLGGGTFDVTILKINEDRDEVLGYSGDSHCGGVDLDRIVAKLIQERLEEYKIDFTTPRNRSKLRDVAEQVKISLSSLEEVDLSEYYDEIGNGVVISRKDFEQQADSIFTKTIKMVTKLMQELHLSPAKIDEVVLIGGSSKIPIISERLGRIFGKEKVSKQINPDEAVAKGATLYAYTRKRFKGSSDVPEDDNFLDLLSDSKVLLDIPSTITDVVPISYGIEVENSRYSPIINRNTPLNKEFIRTYRTTYNNQKQIHIIVYQGEDEFCKNNALIGEFFIPDLPEGPAGRVRAEVKMEVDSDFTLHVSARVLGTENWMTVNIEKEVTNLSEEEKEKLRNEHERDRVLDRQVSEKTLLVNQILAGFDELRQGLEEKQNLMAMETQAEAMSFISCNSGDVLNEKNLNELRRIDSRSSQWRDFIQRL